MKRPFCNTYQLPVRQARTSTVELDLTDVQIRLEDLGGVAPGREVGDGVCLVGDGIPHLDSLGHLGLADAGVGVVARVQAAGRRVVVPEHDDAGVEVRQVLF